MIDIPNTTPPFGNPNDKSSLAHLSPDNSGVPNYNTHKPTQVVPGTRDKTSPSGSIGKYQTPPNIHNEPMYSSPYHTSPDGNYQSYNPSSTPSYQANISDSESYVSVDMNADLENERLAEEQQRAIRHYNKCLIYSSLLLIVPFVLVIFTWFWWTTLFVLTVMACILVYHRAKPDHAGRAAMFYLLIMLVNAIQASIILIYYLARVKSASPFRIVVMIGLAFNIIVASPINMYFAFWLHRSHQMGFYFG